VGYGVAGTLSVSLLPTAISRSDFSEARQHRGNSLHIRGRYLGLFVTHLRRAIVTFKNVTFQLIFVDAAQQSLADDGAIACFSSDFIPSA